MKSGDKVLYTQAENSIEMIMKYIGEDGDKAVVKDDWGTYRCVDPARLTKRKAVATVRIEDPLIFRKGEELGAYRLKNNIMEMDDPVSYPCVLVLPQGQDTLEHLFGTYFYDFEEE